MTSIFKKQPRLSGVRRQFVLVPDASHAPLTLGLYGRGCSANVWSAIGGGADLQSALDTCDPAGAQVELSVYPAQ